MLPALALAAAVLAAPTVHYTIHVDARDLQRYDVAMRIAAAPETLQLAMAVHPEEDNRFWRYLRDLRVEGTDGRAGSVTRVDSTRWRVVLPGGAGTVRYRFEMPPAPTGLRGSWRPVLRETGALLGGMDGFLYLRDFPATPALVTLDVPATWRVATALAPARTRPGEPRTFAAPDAATLLDAPILMGDLREWTFRERDVPFRVVYWALPDAPSFDTTRFVGGIRRLVAATFALTRTVPFARYTFLAQDGATGALEHGASVTLGVPARQLAADPNAHLGQTAHEFFHTWNLVRVRPAGWGLLSDRPTTPTPSLWWSEGVTLYFADVLVRRAGLGDAVGDRARHVAEQWQLYLGNPANARVSPERASRAASEPPGPSEAGMASIYTQGELLGVALDALVRDSTRERRTLDDVMRALDRATSTTRGFTPADLEQAVRRTCACEPRAFFDAHVRGTTPPDVAHALSRVGLRLVVDSVLAADSAGQPLPDLRVAVLPPPSAGGHVRFLQQNVASAWYLPTLRTGTELVAVNGTPVASFQEFRRIVQPLHVGDVVTLDVVRDGRTERVALTLAPWRRARVRAEEIAGATAEQRARRAAWLAGA
jgi:predicted metalloprotease with PDZ domain